jgi:hypothetical protein
MSTPVVPFVVGQHRRRRQDSKGPDEAKGIEHRPLQQPPRENRQPLRQAGNFRQRPLHDSAQRIYEDGHRGGRI